MKTYQWGVDELRRKSRAFVCENLQLLDLRHLADVESFYKKRALLSIRLYKDWLCEYENETDILALLYGSIEGMFLRRQA